MAKNANKTVPTRQDVFEFIQQAPSEVKRKDSEELIQIMQDITGEEPVMWGSSIVGFGSYHYKYATGREGDSMITGFSPRKQALSIYIMPGFSEYGELLEKLGKFKTGRSCLYINKLDDINRDVLKTLIGFSVDYMRDKYPNN